MADKPPGLIKMESHLEPQLCRHGGDNRCSFDSLQKSDEAYFASAMTTSLEDRGQNGESATTFPMITSVGETKPAI